MLTYALFKIVHLFGVSIFLGNIIVTGVWKYLADRTRNPQVVAFAQRLVTLTDWIFTFGGVVLILAGGVGMAVIGGHSFATPWLGVGLAVFTLSGVIWVAVLIPIQMKQAKLARQFENGGDIPEIYTRLNTRWYFWGTIATLIPMANLYVMIAKP